MLLLMSLLTQVILMKLIKKGLVLIMTNIRINETKRTIEVTKAFYKEASKYGTEQYNDLQAVRRDYPNFKVVTNKTANPTKILSCIPITNIFI